MTGGDGFTTRLALLRWRAQVTDIAIETHGDLGIPPNLFQRKPQDFFSAPSVLSVLGFESFIKLELHVLLNGF